MKFIIPIIFFLLLLQLPIPVFAQDEFYGPFPSWANVKTRFGAKGNGTADDTKALQNALDNLAVTLYSSDPSGKPYVVIYLPAGTYQITSTLVLRGKIGVSIIGENPANTVIKWSGGNTDTMFWANGSAYFKVSRLTWDAGNKTDVECIGIHWKDKWKDERSQSFASLNIELSDMTFKGKPGWGISGGTTGGGGTGSNDSEITIKRCSFYNCGHAGIRISGYNALDYWIWDCKFFECNTGVWNSFGNFHVYRSFFSHSVFSDVHHKDGYYTSVRHSYSVGSRALSSDDGGSCNPFKRIYQGNTVIDTKDMSIEYYHLGCITLLDNTFGEVRDKEWPHNVNHKSWCNNQPSMLSVGNNYAHSQPFRIGNDKQRFILAENKKVTAPNSDGVAFENAMPTSPLRSKARIFEIPAGAGSDIIQKIINEASRLKGSKPVIHFGVGKYFIDNPLIIPAGSDIRIVGDGLLYATEIIPRDVKKFAGKFLIEVNGPSFITIQDIQLGSTNIGANSSNGILFRNIDQKNATCIIDQLYSASDMSLVAEGLNYLYIEKNNSFFSSGTYLSGGAIQKSGKGKFTMNCFGGQFASGLTVLNNASFTAKDCWWEGPQRPSLDLKGDGQITIDGAMVAPVTADSIPTIEIQNFRGRVCLLNMYIQGGLNIRPSNRDLKVFGWNLHF